MKRILNILELGIHTDNIEYKILYDKIVNILNNYSLYSFNDKIYLISDDRIVLYTDNKHILYNKDYLETNDTDVINYILAKLNIEIDIIGYVPIFESYSEKLYDIIIKDGSKYYTKIQ